MREGLTAIVSVRLADPQFEGQTKAKLGNTEIRSLVERATNEHFGRWLEEHPNPAKAIVAQGRRTRRGRVSAAKQARELTRRKTALDGVGMPDKLADCASRDRDDTELFIVEGDSAGGSARDARDPKTQAILPLRGKILNVERASMDKVVANAEIQSLTAAIGGGIGADFDVDKVRYGKVIILADADVDGGHIRTLLITFFYRQMTALVDAGRLYVAQPPLYSVEIGGEKQLRRRRRGAPARHRGAPEPPARVRALQGSRRDGPARAARDVHGSRDAPPRAASTSTRPRSPTTILSVLMGDDVEARRNWIQQQRQRRSLPRRVTRRRTMARRKGAFESIDARGQPLPATPSIPTRTLRGGGRGARSSSTR